jgi:hypothetical protein
MSNGKIQVPISYLDFNYHNAKVITWPHTMFVPADVSKFNIPPENVLMWDVRDTGIPSPNVIAVMVNMAIFPTGTIPIANSS